MNEHARWRLDLAREIGPRLYRFAGLRAVVVGGSVARGYSDAYSDIELLLFWDAEPDPDVRRQIITDLRAEFRYPNTDPSHDSALLIRGMPVDLWHLTVASEEAALHQVLDEYSIDLDVSNVLDTMHACIPLYGQDLVRQWKSRVQAYPDELALRFLHAYLPHFHLRRLNFAVHRDNPTAYYHTLTDIQSSLFVILLALNKSYFPTYKWMYHALESMPITPGRIAPRLRQMFDEPPLRAVAQLRDVLAETLAIVETEYPQLDLADVAWTRHALEQPMPRSYQAPGREMSEGKAPDQTE